MWERLNADYGTLLLEPSTPLMRDAMTLYRRVATVNGASPSYARHQRRLLLEAGFARSEGFASVICLGSLEATRQAYELDRSTFAMPSVLLVLARASVTSAWQARRHQDQGHMGRHWSDWCDGRTIIPEDTGSSRPPVWRTRLPARLHG